MKFALAGAPPAFLREDMTLSVEVETGRSDSALVLPQSALHATAPDAVGRLHPRRSRGAALVVEGGRATLRKLRLGSLNNTGAVEVLDGLAGGRAGAVRSGGTDGSLARPARARLVPWRLHRWCPWQRRYAPKTQEAPWPTP
ncbi:MAG: hypothetical protein IPJ36_11830 [Simplicispira sp.]|nr:hypothetical protein [Simplicispira sp.]